MKFKTFIDFKIPYFPYQKSKGTQNINFIVYSANRFYLHNLML